jgi:UDP-glucuronate 4-epimerase
LLTKPFEFIHGDLCDCAVLDELFGSVKLDQVIHLAARAGVRPSLAEPALYQRVNVEGTVNVLEAARKNRVKKIIIASSSSVYGVNSKVPFSESDPIFSAISPYAASKLACESLGHVYHHVYGMDVTMLRLFTVYGPRQRPDLAIRKFATLIHSGQPVPVFGDGGMARDYTYVTDTVDGIIAATQKEFGFDIFNLGESQTVTLGRLVELLETALGKKAMIDRQPVPPGDVPVTFADITKARSRLGYHPQVKIEAGIKLFIDWFRKNTG